MKRSYLPPEGTDTREGWDRCLDTRPEDREAALRAATAGPYGDSRHFINGWLDAWETFGEASFEDIRARIVGDRVFATPVRAESPVSWKVWIHVERCDEENDTYESWGDPHEAGCFDDEDAAHDLAGWAGAIMRAGTDSPCDATVAALARLRSGEGNEVPDCECCEKCPHIGLRSCPKGVS